LKHQREASSFLNNLLSTRIKNLPEMKNIDKINNIGELKPMLEVKLDRFLKEKEKEAIERGMQKGMQKGIRKGIQKGKEEGRIEEKKTIVTTMKEKGYSVNQISEITDIPEKEIKELLTTAK
jgi:predicted transposase/invertase (TIGR01784 family)